MGGRITNMINNFKGFYPPIHPPTNIFIPGLIQSKKKQENKIQSKTNYNKNYKNIKIYSPAIRR